MKKKILIIVLFSLYVSAAVAGDTIFCKDKDYRGYIFDKDYIILMSVKHQRSRYTPACADIAKAENLLRSRIGALNRHRWNQYGGCPVIHQKLQMYFRQYLGFINNKGQRIIWINLFWDESLEKDASKHILMVFDGCSYFWNIEVNIDAEKVYNLEINGSA